MGMNIRAISQNDLKSYSSIMAILFAVSLIDLQLARSLDQLSLVDYSYMLCSSFIGLSMILESIQNRNFSFLQPGIGTLIVILALSGFSYSLLQPAPTELAPNLSLLFLSVFLLGTITYLKAKQRSAISILFVWLLLLVVVFSTFIAHVLSLALDLPLYDHLLKKYVINITTSVGLLCLCLLQLHSFRYHPCVQLYFLNRRDRQIVAQQVVLIICLGLFAAMGGAGILAKETQTGIQGSLVDALHANSQNFSDTIAEVMENSKRIAYQAALQDKAHTPLQDALQEMLEMYKRDGVTSIQVRDAAGSPLLSVGKGLGAHGAKARLQHYQAWLFWQGGLNLVSSMPFYRKGIRVGDLEVQTKLSQLDKEFDHTERLGKSGEIVLCTPDGMMMICFPSNLNHGVIRLLNPVKQNTFPMGYALQGKTGVIFGHDYRGKLVLAAYQPVRDLGLGMVQKVDADELFIPAKSQIVYAVAALLTVSSLVAWLLYRRTHPLVHDLVFAEAYARAILNNIPEAVVTTDNQGIVRSFNLSAKRIFGEGFAERESIFPLFPNSEKNVSEDPLDASMHIEGSLRKQDGAHLTYELTIGSLSFREEKLLIFVVRDLTERKQAELKLQESERHMRNLLDNLQAGVVVHAQDSSVKYMNRAATRFFGFEDGLHGQRPIDLPLHFLGEDGNIIPLDALPDTRGSADGSLFNDCVVGIKSGRQRSPRWALASSFPDLDEQGSVREIIVSFVDITERRNIEHELVEASCKLEKLNKLYRVLSQVNAATVRVNNRSELFHDICNILVEPGGFRLAWIGLLEGDEIVPIVHAGQDEGYLELLGKTGLMALDGPVARMIQTGSSQICQNIEYDPRMSPWREEALKRGYRSSAGFPLDLEGRWIGVINVYADQVDFFSEDITGLLDEIYAAVTSALEHLDHREKRAAAEEQLRQLNADLEFRVESRTRQLEAANTELEAFSYSVSHDLRAPLRHIDGFSEMLARKYACQLDEEAMFFLDRMRKASGRMGELINDLLELSRVTLLEIRKTEIDLSRIAADVIEGLRSGNRNVTWTIETGITVPGDGRLMKIVMENLLGNAWKFTSVKSEAIIEFGSFEKDGEKILYVRDNGVGFDMQYSSRLFGTFQRLHTSEEFEGTGIGLATVQRIIRKHGGRIWGRAEPGVGATFYFQL